MNEAEELRAIKDVLILDIIEELKTEMTKFKIIFEAMKEELIAAKQELVLKNAEIAKIPKITIARGEYH